MSDRQTVTACAAIFAAQISVNLGAALGKGLFPAVGPEGVAMLRTVIAACILLAWVRPWHRRFSASDAPWLLAYGLSLGAMNLLIYWAFQYIPIGVAVAIEISGPLAIVLLTSRTLRDFLWLALALTGLALLVPWLGHATRLDPLGIAFALGAATCWALYIVVGKRAAAAGAKEAVAMGMAIACLVTVPFGVSHAGHDILHPAILAMGLMIALLSSAIPYLLEMMALKQLSSRVFGVITSSAPAIAALAGYVVLDERLTALQWVAIAAMIGASLGCALSGKAPPGKESV